MTKPIPLLITLILITPPPLEAINLTDDYTTQEYDETTLIDDVENVPNFYEENPQFGNSNPGVVIPLERILAGLEALENEEDLIISDESSLHHTKYNQSQEDQGDGAHGDKPKYAMFENFPIVNTPAAKDTTTLQEQNLVKVDEQSSKTDNNLLNSKIKETAQLNLKNKKVNNEKQEAQANQHPRTNRYPDKKFGRIGGYKQGLRKENNNPPQIKEEENQTVNPNDFTNESKTADNDVIEEQIDDNTKGERKSGHQFGRVGSSSFNNEFSKRRRRPNQVPAWRRGNHAQFKSQNKYSNSEPETENKHDNDANEDINQQHTEISPTARRARLRISAPQSENSQHDILGPQIFNIDPDLSEDAIISHLLSSTNNQNKDVSFEHRGRGKISDHVIEDTENDDNTDNTQAEDIAQEENNPEPTVHSIFHPYSQNNHRSQYNNNIRKRKVSNNQRKSGNEATKPANKQTKFQKHSSYEESEPVDQVSYHRQSKDFRFEPEALDEKSSKDVANEDSKYIEEHEFHVEQDDAEAVADHHQLKESNPRVSSSRWSKPIHQNIEATAHQVHDGQTKNKDVKFEPQQRSTPVGYPSRQSKEIKFDSHPIQPSRQSKEIKFENYENKEVIVQAPRQSKDIKFENDNPSLGYQPSTGYRSSRQSKGFRFPTDNEEIVDYEDNYDSAIDDEIFVDDKNDQVENTRVAKEINGHNFGNVEKESTVEEATQDNQNKDDANIESVATTRNSRHQQTNSKRNSAFVGKSSPVTKNGDYNFSFISTDGHSRAEEGVVSSQGSKAIKGSYSYTSPDGQLITMSYTADENGFRPVGSHIPAVAPLPKHVQRLLDHLAKVNQHQ